MKFLGLQCIKVTRHKTGVGGFIARREAKGVRANLSRPLKTLYLLPNEVKEVEIFLKSLRLGLWPKRTCDLKEDEKNPPLLRQYELYKDLTVLKKSLGENRAAVVFFGLHE